MDFSRALSVSISAEILVITHLLKGRFACPERDALRAIFESVRGIGHTFVEILVSVDDLYFFEPGVAHRADKLCIQQSTGNSTRPQGNVVQRVGGYLPLDQNVSHLQPPARLENAEPFTQRLGLVE